MPQKTLLLKAENGSDQSSADTDDSELKRAFVAGGNRKSMTESTKTMRFVSYRVFAAKIFAIAKLGDKVIITDGSKVGVGDPLV